MKLTVSDKDAFVSAVMADVPSIDYAAEMWKLVEPHVVAQMPLKIKAVYEDKDLRGCLQNCKVFLPSHIWVIYQPIGQDFRPEKDAALWEQLVALDNLHVEQENARRVLHSKLCVAIRSLKTLAQLKKALPEFEKYMPTEVTATPNLPALANLVTEFTKAGWPKSRAATSLPAKRGGKGRAAAGQSDVAKPKGENK